MREVGMRRLEVRDSTSLLVFTFVFFEKSLFERFGFDVSKIDLFLSMPLYLYYCSFGLLIKS